MKNYGFAKCIICEKEFTKRMHNQVSCSDECRKLYNARQTRKWRQEFSNRSADEYKKWKSSIAKKSRNKPGAREKSYHTERKSWLKRLYNLTPEQWGELLKSQDNCCGVCKQPFLVGETPAVDHDHNTGEVRSLVHKFPCNIVVGYVEKYSQVVDLAKNYLINRKQ